MAERFRPSGMNPTFTLQGVSYRPDDSGWLTAPNATVAAAMAAAGLMSEFVVPVIVSPAAPSNGDGMRDNTVYVQTSS